MIGSILVQKSTLLSRVKELGIGIYSNDYMPITMDLNITNNYFAYIPIVINGTRESVRELNVVPLLSNSVSVSVCVVTEADVL